MQHLEEHISENRGDAQGHTVQDQAQSCSQLQGGDDPGGIKQYIYQ